FSHSLYDEDLHVNVGLAQLFQRGIVRVVVKCLSQLKRRKLDHAHGEGRRPFQGQKPRRGVAPDFSSKERFAAVLCDQGGRLRELSLSPSPPPSCCSTEPKIVRVHVSSLLLLCRKLRDLRDGSPGVGKGRRLGKKQGPRAPPPPREEQSPTRHPRRQP